VLLRQAVDAIRGQLRSYDLIVRVGGDEFLCVMPGATVGEIRQRFEIVVAALADDPRPCAIKVGFADLSETDTAADLVRRADAAMPVSPARS
jgi:GGDEF domain-containing protein